MKKYFLALLCFILLVSFTTPVVAWSDYTDGYKDGYGEGYIYEKPLSIKPISPIPPIPKVGESDYKDGYNRGLIDGYKKQQKNDFRKF